jgi:hypothetical protein
MFQLIELLSFNLLQDDIFVRWGLTSGMLLHSDDFVFGTAMTEAYHLERDHADGPLVLVSDTVLQDTKELGLEFMQWLRQDGANRFYVDYLMRYAEYKLERTPGPLSSPIQPLESPILPARGSCTTKTAFWKRPSGFRNTGTSECAAQGFLAEIVADPKLERPDESPTIIFRRLVAPVSPSSSEDCH